MFLTNEDFKLLEQVYNNYFNCVEDSETCEKLYKLIVKLKTKKYKRNELNTKRVAEKRKVDKNYAQRKKI